MAAKWTIFYNMHIYLKWGTNAPQVEMFIQIIVPLLAHSGTSYNLMETL